MSAEPDPTPTEAELQRLARGLCTGEVPNAQTAMTLYLFLPVRVEVDGDRLHVRSSLEALLRDTRSVVGRDPSTGELVDFDHSRTWLGALGYLALIDQLASALQVPTAGNRATPFESLLIWDGCVAPDEAAALYALRCAFAHNFGLLNDPKSRIDTRRRLLRHRFELTANRRDLLKLRSRTDRMLDGPMGAIAATNVDILSLGDEVERLVADLRQRHVDGDGLPIRATVGLGRFLMSYFFFHGDPIETGDDVAG